MTEFKETEDSFWNSVNTLWLISDTHFRHRKIRIFEPCRPPNFENIIIEACQALVGPDDILLHLGDFTFGGPKDRSEIAERFNQIRGRKALIRGNHDRHSDEYYHDECGFDRIYSLAVIIDNILLSHYPRHNDVVPPKDGRYDEQRRKLTEIYKTNNCIAQVHGHSHSFQMQDPSFINVSVECINFMPIRWGVIKQRAALLSPDLDSSPQPPFPDIQCIV